MSPTLHVIVAMIMISLLPRTVSAQSQTLEDDVFVTTYGGLKAADLPICGPLPEPLKSQVWFGTPKPMSDEKFVMLFGDEASLFGIKGTDFWYVRETRQAMDREKASRLVGMDFTRLYHETGEYDSLPILCGVRSEESLARIRAARAARSAPEPATKTVARDCQFCELPGGDYLNAIYEGDYEKQDRMAWDYLMEVRNRDTNDAMMGVFMQNVGLGSENLTVLQELLASYMQKYAYHDKSCLKPGAFTRRVTWKKPDVVTTLNGWEFARMEGASFDATYSLNKEFQQACNQLCGDAGSMTAAVNGLNMTGTRYSLMDVFEGLDLLFEKYSCSSPEVKIFEQNMLAQFDRENEIPSDGRRNTLLDVAFVEDEMPDPGRFKPDERVFPQMAERRKLVALEGDSAKAKGSRYLIANAEIAGVQVSDTGLQYQILSSGSGISPSRFSMTTFHYRMLTVDGTVLADTWEAGQPASAPINGLIDGWAEGLTLMKPGGEARLVVPPYLAYGDENIPGIEPGSVLVFEIELLSVK